MNHERRLLILFGAVGITGILTGCVTESLFKDDRYGEELSSVLISEDSKKIVFIGKNYHYIFDAPPILVKTLTASFHKSVSALLSNFHVDGEGNVKGDVTLTLSIKAPDQDKLAAMELGYRKGTILNSGYYCEYRVTLTGIRYKSNGIQPQLVSQKLNRTYNVNVIAEQSAGEKAAKALLTPITVAIDGALLIGAIPLVLVGAIAITTVVTVECHDKPNCFK